MNMNEICKKLEDEFNASAVNFYKYNDSYVIKGLDRSKDYPAFKYYIVKNDDKGMITINEIKDKVLIDYFSKGENVPSDIVY
ncbi:MAG: hypothetical protein IKE91_03030 [Clostridia bacterium]|nr:hypothetical protein [Clostridia bacterium]